MDLLLLLQLLNGLVSGAFYALLALGLALILSLTRIINPHSAPLLPPR